MSSVLVVVDAVGTARQVLQQALWVAEDLGSRVTVLLGPDRAAVLLDGMFMTGHPDPFDARTVREIAADLHGHGAELVEEVVPLIPTTRNVARIAADRGATYLVVSSRLGGLRRRLNNTELRILVVPIGRHTWIRPRLFGRTL